jgi:hypothetical protein
MRIVPGAATVRLGKIDLCVKRLVVFQIIPVIRIKRSQFGINRTFVSKIPISLSSSFEKLRQLFIFGKRFDVRSKVTFRT